jgi:hypothetical protein
MDFGKGFSSGVMAPVIGGYYFDKQDRFSVGNLIGK